MTTPPPAGPGARLAFEALRQCGPDTRGGRYLRHFWHPVARVDDLAAGQLRKLSVLGAPFTLARFEDGTHTLLDDRCPHRGVPLSLGRVQDGAVRCPYHGWRFGPDGACVDAPGEPASVCAAAGARARPLREAFGLLFAWLGDGPAAAFPYADRVPEGMVVYRMAPIQWPTNFVMRLENTTDFSHLQAAHEYSGLDRFLPAGYRQTYTALARGHRVVLSAEHDPVGVLTEGALGHPMTYLLPNLFHHRQPLLQDGSWSQHISWHTPATDDLCRTFTIVLVAAADPDAFFRAHPEPRQSDTGVVALAEEVLAGRSTLAELRGHANLTEIEDCVMVVAQHRAGGSTPSVLGRTDPGVASLRQLLGRDILASETEGWVVPDLGPSLDGLLVSDR